MSNQGDFRMCTFNCRSLKTSVTEISNLCDSCDFLCIQEHWLLSTELRILNNLHEDFYGLGKSAVDLTSDILLGRPYGGTCMLYRKSLAQSVKTVDTYDSTGCGK